MTDNDYINAAVRLWEKPHESENTLLIQREGIEAPSGVGLSFVDRVPGGAWVMAWVYVEDEEDEQTR